MPARAAAPHIQASPKVTLVTQNTVPPASCSAVPGDLPIGPGAATSPTAGQPAFKAGLPNSAAIIRLRAITGGISSAPIAAITSGLGPLPKSALVVAAILIAGGIAVTPPASNLLDTTRQASSTISNLPVQSPPDVLLSLMPAPAATPAAPDSIEPAASFSQPVTQTLQQESILPVAVPEPASLLMIGVGVVGALVRRHTRR